MYAGEYAESLKYQYCRTPHYLRREIIGDPRFSGPVGKHEVHLLWEDIGAKRAVRIKIICDTSDMRILRFVCSCDTTDFCYRPSAAEPGITRENKSYFKQKFVPYLSKTPQI